MTDDACGGLRGLRATPGVALLEHVRHAYGIECDLPPVDLGGSSSLNLLVHDGSARWVVRVHRPHVTESRLYEIQRVRRHLDAGGVPCSQPKPTREGQTWATFEGRLVEVEPFVDRDGHMDTWAALAEGMPVLARLHDRLREVAVGEAGRIPRFANHLAREEALAATRRGAERIRAWQPPPALLELAADAESLARQVSESERSFDGRLPSQLVHGDFWHDNVLMRHGRVALVTDFDFMGERLRIDDLALTIFFACMQYVEDSVSDDQLARVRSLVDSYDGACELPLSAHERLALPAAIARQPLWSIGGWVAWLDDDEAARRHAERSHGAVRWASQLLRDLNRWQAACG